MSAERVLWPWPIHFTYRPIGFRWIAARLPAGMAGTRLPQRRHYGLERGDLLKRCGGRGLRVFAARVPAASDLAGIYKDVGAVLMTLSTSSVPLFRFSTSVSSGSAIRAIRTSTGDDPFERKIFPPVSST